MALPFRSKKNTQHNNPTLALDKQDPLLKRGKSSSFINLRLRE